MDKTPTSPKACSAQFEGTRGTSPSSDPTPTPPVAPPARFAVSEETRYATWYETPEGAFALARKEELLCKLMSGWVRRSRSMLVMGAGQGVFLENLWDLGFDVTGQESVPELLAEARTRLGSRADFAFGVPDHLPFDDCTFDYAVAVDALEFWRDPEAVLREMNRIACAGIILIFPNTWSLFGLRCRLARGDRNYGTFRPYLRSPRAIHRLIKKVFGQQRAVWRSTLLAPVWTWKPHPALECINTVDIRLPVGGFTGVRIDFGPISTGTPLAVRSGAMVSTAE